eukprot:Selendium_serpulae@DN4891_c0_g1_i3.p1
MTSSITPSSSASSAASPVTAVKAAFEAAVRSAFPDAIVAELRIDMALSDPKFGDYQCNSAMALFKKHKKALADLGFASPKAVGAAIEAKLADYLTTGTDADGTGTDADGTGTPKLLAKAGTAPQGFVTVTLNNEWLELINKDLDVSRLTKYTYALCGAFTSFYSNCQVVGSPQQQSRLALCQLTLRFLEVAFGMIGIQALERL